MVKRFVVLRKKRGMSSDDFHAYWCDTHGPLIGAIPGIRKYVQYHVRSEADPAEEDSIDGIAALWFDSEEAQRQSWTTPEYAKAVEDEPNLFDMTSHSIHPMMEMDTVVLVQEQLDITKQNEAPH